jgi:hypothetical protein
MNDDAGNRQVEVRYSRWLAYTYLAAVGGVVLVTCAAIATAPAWGGDAAVAAGVAALLLFNWFWALVYLLRSVRMLSYRGAVLLIDETGITDTRAAPPLTLGWDDITGGEVRSWFPHYSMLVLCSPILLFVYIFNPDWCSFDAVLYLAVRGPGRGPQGVAFEIYGLDKSPDEIGLLVHKYLHIRLPTQIIT